MAVESTDLSFLRCWNCESLIPASSEHCRLCGAAIATEAVGGPERSPHRLRSKGASPENLLNPDSPQTDNPAPRENKSSNKKRARPDRQRLAEQEDATTAPQKIPSKPLSAPASASRLVGWLALINGGTDESIELREQQCFLSGKALRPDDIVLAASHISSPHALLSCSCDNGKTRIVIQDMLSESGIRIRRNGKELFVTEGEHESLRHGDQVFLSNIELVVCLLPRR